MKSFFLSLSLALTYSVSLTWIVPVYLVNYQEAQQTNDIKLVLLTASFFLGRAATGLFMFSFISRLGLKPTLLVSLTLFLICHAAAFRLVQQFYLLCLSRLILGLSCPLDIAFRWTAFESGRFNHRSFMLTNLALVVGQVIGSFSNAYSIQGFFPSVVLSGSAIAAILAIVAMILTCTRQMPLSHEQNLAEELGHQRTGQVRQKDASSLQVNGPAYNEFSQSLQLFESASNVEETIRQGADSDNKRSPSKATNLRLNLDDIDDMCDHDEESNTSARAATFNQFEVTKNGMKGDETVELDSLPCRAHDKANASAIELVANHSTTEHGMISAVSSQRRTKSIGDGGSVLQNKLTEKKGRSSLFERKESPGRAADSYEGYNVPPQQAQSEINNRIDKQQNRGQSKNVKSLRIRKRYYGLCILMGFLFQAYEELQNIIFNMSCPSCLSFPRSTSSEISALTYALSGFLALLMTCKDSQPPLNTKPFLLSLSAMLLLLELLWLVLTSKTRSQPDSVVLALLIVSKSFTLALSWKTFILGVKLTNVSERLSLLCKIYLMYNAGCFIGSLISQVSLLSMIEEGHSTLLFHAIMICTLTMTLVTMCLLKKSEMTGEDEDEMIELQVLSHQEQAQVKKQRTQEAMTTNPQQPFESHKLEEDDDEQSKASARQPKRVL